MEDGVMYFELFHRMEPESIGKNSCEADFSLAKRRTYYLKSQKIKPSQKLEGSL
jgi:hypothetical protein